MPLAVQHRCLLAFYEGRQKNDFAIWKFQRIVMGGPPVLVNLSEDRGPVADHRFVPWAQPVGPSPNFVREGQLRTAACCTSKPSPEPPCRSVVGAVAGRDCDGVMLELPQRRSVAVSR